MTAEGRRLGARRAQGWLAQEQAALRRVATLVARGGSPPEVFATVTEELGRLLNADITHMMRYEPDGQATVVAAWSEAGEGMPVGARFPTEGHNVTTLVRSTRRPARIDDLAGASGEIPAQLRALGVHSSGGAPIVVDQELWGALIVSSTQPRSMPRDTEERIARFGELVAMAISNAQARAEVTRLAEEQAALRRVATLVARGLPPDEVFPAVAREVGLVLGAEVTHMARYESGGELTIVAGDRLVPSGTRAPLEPGSVTDLIQRTGRPTHIDDYRTVSGELAGKARARGLRCGVGAPIVVDGKLWGAIVALFPDSLPWPSVERRLSEFTELVGTAISNAQARSEVARLAEEQAALRRVATLIARGAPPEEVFPAVAREVAQLLGDATPNIMRYEADGEVTFLVGDTTLAAGTRTRLAGDSVTERIRRTGAPAYVENYRNLWGTAADIARERSLRCGVGAPIVVDGKLWGAMLALFPDPLPSPSAAQRRISEFTELVATALSNAHARAELAASRARIVAAADQARRRIERDLHDGTQQRLVTLTLRLRAAEQSLSSHQKELRKELADVAGGLTDALEELRELARGIHPAILSEAGLAPALKALARRSAIPIELELGVEGRLPAPVEIASYYAVSEGLANAAKHARASVVHVRAELLGGELRVTIQDDGVGGAEPSRGSGLLGLTDRMAALGGVLAVLSPAGEGTTLHLKLPIAD